MKREPQAVEILATTLRVLGVPENTVSNGTIRVEIGEEVQDGTIRLVSRGTNSWSETARIGAVEDVYVRTPEGMSERHGTEVTRKGVEWLLGGHTPYFPTFVLAEAMTAETFAAEVLPTDGESTSLKIRIKNTFAGRANEEALADFTTRDVWIDPTTNLPAKMTYQQKRGSGADPSFAMEVRYSDYREVNGIKYPFTVEVLRNGTLWKTVRIDDVSVNTGVTEVINVR